jgi:hypothetical protein
MKPTQFSRRFSHLSYQRGEFTKKYKLNALAGLLPPPARMMIPVLLGRSSWITPFKAGR